MPCLVDGRRCLHSGAPGPHGPLSSRRRLDRRDRGADGSTLKVTAPALVSPVDGARAEDRRPTLDLAQLDRQVRRHRRRLRHRGQHADGRGLLADRRRVARLRRAPASTSISSTTLCIRGASARTSATPTASGRGRPGRASCRRRVPSPPAPPIGAVGPAAAPRRSRRWVLAKPASRGRTIRRSCAPSPARSRRALQHSCQPEGGSWEFMDRTVDALRAKDGRYGYNCKRGNCNDPSLDVVSYFYGDRPRHSKAAPRFTSSTSLAATAARPRR